MRCFNSIPLLDTLPLAATGRDLLPALWEYENICQPRPLRYHKEEALLKVLTDLDAEEAAIADIQEKLPKQIEEVLELFESKRKYEHITILREEEEFYWHDFWRLPRRLLEAPKATQSTVPELREEIRRYLRNMENPPWPTDFCDRIYSENGKVIEWSSYSHESMIQISFKVNEAAGFWCGAHARNRGALRLLSEAHARL